MVVPPVQGHRPQHHQQVLYHQQRVIYHHQQGLYHHQRVVSLLPPASPLSPPTSPLPPLESDGSASCSRAQTPRPCVEEELNHWSLKYASCINWKTHKHWWIKSQYTKAALRKSQREKSRKVLPLFCGGCSHSPRICYASHATKFFLNPKRSGSICIKSTGFQIMKAGKSGSNQKQRIERLLDSNMFEVYIVNHL